MHDSNFLGGYVFVFIALGDSPPNRPESNYEGTCIALPCPGFQRLENPLLQTSRSRPARMGGGGRGGESSCKPAKFCCAASAAASLRKLAHSAHSAQCGTHFLYCMAPNIVQQKKASYIAWHRI